MTFPKNTSVRIMGNIPPELKKEEPPYGNVKKPALQILRRKSTGRKFFDSADWIMQLKANEGNQSK